MGESENIRIQELKEENELLLLQLHQVQEELESYYLDSNSAAGTAAALRVPETEAPGSSFAGADRLPGSLISRVREARGDSPGTRDASKIIRQMPEFNRLQVNLDHANRKIDQYQADLQRLKSEKEGLEATRQQLAEHVKGGARELEQARSEWASERQALEEKRADETAALKSQIHELEQEREELEAARRDLAERVESVNRALDQTRSEWTDERQVLEISHAEEIKALQSQISKLEQEREELKDALGEQVEAGNRALDQARLEWNKECRALETTRTTEIQDLKAHIAVVERQRDSYQQECRELTEKIESLEHSLKEKSETIEAARSDVAVSVRLQTLREQDLKELQARYGELLQQKEEQDELLTKLHDRLSVAADCLKQLELENDDVLDAESTRKLVRSLTGDPDNQG